MAESGRDFDSVDPGPVRRLGVFDVDTLDGDNMVSSVMVKQDIGVGIRSGSRSPYLVLGVGIDFGVASGHDGVIKVSVVNVGHDSGGLAAGPADTKRRG